MRVDVNSLPKWAQAQIAHKMAKEQKRRQQFEASTLPPPTPKEAKEQKYRNQKQERTLSDGTVHVFDSKKEAEEYDRLALLEAAGEITDLQIQVKYELIPSQYETYERYNKKGVKLKDGMRCTERSCSYVADFVYTDKDGNKVVEDTKGVKTPEYLIKRKLMRYIHGIAIKET